MAFTPLGARVLLTEPPKEQITASGIVLPETAIAEKEIIEVSVVSRGGDVHRVKDGDTVIVKRYLTEKLTLKEKDFLLIDEDDILAIVTKDEETTA